MSSVTIKSKPKSSNDRLVDVATFRAAARRMAPVASLSPGQAFGYHGSSQNLTSVVRWVVICMFESVECRLLVFFLVRLLLKQVTRERTHCAPRESSRSLPESPSQSYLTHFRNAFVLYRKDKTLEATINKMRRFSFKSECNNY